MKYVYMSVISNTIYSPTKQNIQHFINLRLYISLSIFLTDVILCAFQISGRTMWRHELRQRRRLLKPVQEGAVVQLRRYVTVNAPEIKRTPLSAWKYSSRLMFCFCRMAHYVCVLLMSVPAGCSAINLVARACHRRYTVSYNDKVRRAGKVPSDYLFIVRNLLGACDVNRAL